MKNYIGQIWKSNIGEMHTTIYSSTGTVLKWSNNTATLKLILSAIIFPQYWYTVAMCAYIYMYNTGTC